VKISARSSLAHVAVAVGDGLRRAGIRAVLTGGACANLYSGGAHKSLDADFVLIGPCTLEELDGVLAKLGFERKRDRYVHRLVPFFVEFPRGPLGIGEDFRIRPVWMNRGAAKALTLSATDTCRDRLAAFYHWNDRQSLAAAVAIAMRNRVVLSRVRTWSRSEGNLDGYDVFLGELKRARTTRRHPQRSRRSRSKS